MTAAGRPSEVADQVAEGIRTLNHLTRDGALQYPSDVYEVIGELETAASRLPQLLGQLAGWLTAEHAAGRIGHDSGGDPAEYIAAVTDALDRARQDCTTLAVALDGAHDAAAGLTGT